MRPKIENIVFLGPENIGEVADLFMNELPDDFCSIMGAKFLNNRFLPHFLNADPHIGYIAKDGDQVVGFILGAKADGYYKNFAKKHFLGLVIYSFAACIRDFRKLKYFVDVGRVIFGTDAFKPSGHDLELLYICVAKNHQGTGIGIRLVEELLQKGRHLGFNRCVVKTFADNEKTNQFYRKCKFEKKHLNQGRIWYSNSIASTNNGSAT